MATRTRATDLQVALWSRKAREASVKRDEAIRAMRAEGFALRTIAKAAGLTHSAIAKIVDRDEPGHGS